MASGTTTARARTDLAVVAAVSALAGTVGMAILARVPGEVGARAAGAEVAFVSLFAESLPFLLIGAAISALLHGRLGRSLLRAAAGRPRLAAAVAPLTGLALPVCDCGVLPLARELRAGGATRAVNSFLAGAPIVNPIVIVSTLVAFPGSPEVAVGRVVGGLFVALAVAALAAPPQHGRSLHVPEHDHEHGGALGAMRDHVGAELARTAPVLAAGALLAAIVKALVPTSTLTSAAGEPLLAALAMMLLAFIMSICSQADAFVAASLPVGALPRLAFLILGPMFDLRLAVLYRKEFGGRWVTGYAAVVVPATLVAATACAVAGLA
jgi:hypothetical protein